MKKAFRLALMLFIVLGLVACSSQGKEEETNGEGTGSSDTLTVYSPHPAETINILVKEFQDETGITVDIVAAGTGELLKRVESEAQNPLGDVLWGGGAESLAAFKEYFDPYESPALENISANYYSPDFTWTGESPLPMVMMVNTNLVDEADVPKSWSDLTNEVFKGQIAMADPAKSGSAYTILATMIQTYETKEEGWDFIADFYKNLDGKVLTSSSSVYKGVADGEYAVGLTLEKEAIKYVLSGSPVEIVYPEDGTSAIPDGIAIIKGTKNEENAKKFVDFALSKNTQTIMSEELSRRSILNGVEAPEGLPKLEDIKLVDYDFDWVSSNKEEILNQWKQIVISD